MEFLSRTWSPSSSDFFQLLSLNNLVPRLEDEDGIDKEQEDQGTTQNKLHCIRANGLSMEHTKTWSVHRRQHQTSKMKLRQLKAWLSGELLRSISRGSPRKRKEELRLHVSQVHAALSVASLAAAISGILANCTLEPNKQNMNMINGGHEDWDHMNMNSIVASAAALVATVCAEAAESAGAHRAHVSSVISSGLQTSSSADMLTLTATAATCLRGAATLEKRAASKSRVSDDQKMLSNGSKLRIRAPAGVY
ncbi:hypothetical protein J5N97_018719 [Dioscorea zingiberensis]|uniref:VAN3-binding protein-like auxin canalisation domain-containing protein n=1 Tax=Dioscorea zingiberensis TaxID=325984 RepID=A0A9D5CDG9_9LILI|nr:hypothetical protein J5N97_018719 [Dioscorea zingiberensis]